MKLIPAGLEASSDWEDGLWVEKPGYPFVDCSWIHPPREGQLLPEFEFEEGDDKNKNEPPPTFYIGSGDDCHVRLPDERLPQKVCHLYKQGRTWFLEAVCANRTVHLGSQCLDVGKRMALKDGDLFSLVCPPTALSYRIRISDEDNWYLDQQNEKDYPNKYPGRFPFRSSLPEAPPAPEELKRLAWQTDQMRRRSEEDQVRVADWAAFSQYVKRHYYKHGIECVPWAVVGRLRPVDPKPRGFQPRAYPGWIAHLLQQERQLPGVDPARPLPFASSLAQSGLQASKQMQFQSQPPTLEDMYAGSSVTATASAPTLQEPRKVNLHLRQSFRDWLESMDDSLFLLQYHDQFVANFDSLEQVHEIYYRNGELSRTFFEDTGIRKLGHRRIFEKWFRDYCK